MKEVEKKVKKKMFINIKVFDKKHKNLKINKIYFWDILYKRMWKKNFKSTID